MSGCTARVVELRGLQLWFPVLHAVDAVTSRVEHTLPSLDLLCPPPPFQWHPHRRSAKRDNTSTVRDAHWPTDLIFSLLHVVSFPNLPHRMEGPSYGTDRRSCENSRLGRLHFPGVLRWLQSNLASSSTPTRYGRMQGEIHNIHGAEKDAKGGDTLSLHFKTLLYMGHPV